MRKKRNHIIKDRHQAEAESSQVLYCAVLSLLLVTVTVFVYEPNLLSLCITREESLGIGVTCRDATMALFSVNECFC